MDMLNIAKSWVLARWAERTTWDGGVIIGLSLSCTVYSLSCPGHSISSPGHSISGPGQALTGPGTDN